MIQSAHDISEGGLFITLAESAMQSGKGFDICTDATYRQDAWLFGEAQGRITVTIKSENIAKLEELMNKAGVPYLHIGEVKGSDMVIDEVSFGSINAQKELYDNAIAKTIQG